MRFPVTICERNTLVVAREDFFEGLTGSLDEATRSLEFNVTPDGRAHLRWILDADGMLTELSSLGVQKPGVLQSLGIRRRRERYELLPPRTVTAAELLRMVEPLKDDYPEAPQVADLRDYLATCRPDEVIGREAMRRFLGE